MFSHLIITLNHLNDQRGRVSWQATLLGDREPGEQVGRAPRQACGLHGAEDPPPLHAFPRPRRLALERRWSAGYARDGDCRTGLGLLAGRGVCAVRRILLRTQRYCVIFYTIHSLEFIARTSRYRRWSGGFFCHAADVGASLPPLREGADVGGDRGGDRTRDGWCRGAVAKYLNIYRTIYNIF